MTDQGKFLEEIYVFVFSNDINDYQIEERVAFKLWNVVLRTLFKLAKRPGLAFSEQLFDETVWVEEIGDLPQRFRVRA